MNNILSDNLSILIRKKKYNLLSVKLDEDIIEEYATLFNIFKVEKNINMHNYFYSKKEFIYIFRIIAKQIFEEGVDIDSLIEKTIFYKEQPDVFLTDSFVIIDNKMKVESIITDVPFCVEAICLLLHEYGHCFIEKGYPFNNCYYDELLSICLERIAGDIIGKKLKKVEDNINMIRFDDTKKALNEFMILSNNKKVFKKINNYATIEEILTYVTSDLLAIILMNYYNEDSKLFLKRINSVIKNDQKIEDVIKYYNIDLAKAESYEIVKRKLKKLESVK